MRERPNPRTADAVREPAPGAGGGLAGRADPPGPWQRQTNGSPRQSAQRRQLDALHGPADRQASAAGPPLQRKLDFAGPGLPERPDWYARRSAVHAALMRLEGRVDARAFAEFRQALPDGSHFGVRLIELIHDPIEHGVVHLDNEQQLAGLMLELLRLERGEIAAIDLRTALVQGFTGTLQKGKDDAVLGRLNSGFGDQWARDALLELGIAPPGVDPKRFEHGEPFDPKDSLQLQRVHDHLAKKLADARDRTSVPTTPTGEPPVWHTAYLGRGAAVAYHMIANANGADPLQTIVIGKAQPWAPDSKDDRAFESVNHAMGWIVPERSKVEHPDEFASTAEFSERIAEVIRAHSVIQVEAELGRGAVRKAEHDPWYEIQAGQRVYRARHVVSALGIGRHKPPIDAKEFERRGQGPTSDNARVMDMDEYHRQRKTQGSAVSTVRERNKGKLKLVIVGPNAGVDVAYTTTNEGCEVLWFTSTKPFWIEGFANHAIRTDQLRIVLAYFADYSAVRQQGEVVGVTVTAGTDKHTKEVEAALKQKGVRNVLNAGAVDHNEVFDFMIYAQGPDDSASAALDDTLRERLKKSPIGERLDPRFGGVGLATGNKQGQHLDLRDLQAVEAGETIDFSAALLRHFGRTLEDEDSLRKRAQEAKEAMEKVLGGLAPVAKAKSEVALNARVQDADGTSFEVVGAQSARLAPDGWGREMMPVVDSLPPTVVGNDQLTPSRSRAFASAHSVPAHVGQREGGIDLVTDDQVAIALFIAAHYDLPPLVADYVTRRIIDERHGTASERDLLTNRTGVRPDRTKKGSFGASFQTGWIEKLEALQSIFR